MQKPTAARALIRAKEAGTLGEVTKVTLSATAQTTTGLERTYPSHYITTCWAHEEMEAPQIPVQVDGRDAAATLDSGSAITMARPSLMDARALDDVAIHGDTKHYPTADVKLITTRGRCQTWLSTTARGHWWRACRSPC